jgi:hypothetical protein
MDTVKEERTPAEDVQVEDAQVEPSPVERALLELSLAEETPEGPLKERAIELRWQAYVAAIEAECLNLGIGSSKTFELKDLQAYQRLRGRFWRLRLASGLDYRTEIDGNNVVVTRVAEDEGDNENHNK